MTGYIDYSNLNVQLQNLINASSSGGIKSINGVFADAQGNVEIPIHKTNPIKLDVSGTDAEYKDGFGIYSIDYKKLDYTDYLDNNESYRALEDSKLVIFTFKDTSTGTYYQEIKSIVDEKVKALYYRVGNNLGAWQELVEITGGQGDVGTVVRAIDGVEPQTNGNIVLPLASTTLKGMVKVDGDTIKIDANGVISSSGGEYIGELPERTDYGIKPDASTGENTVAVLNVPDYNPLTDTLIPLVDGNPLGVESFSVSYNESNSELTINLLNGEYFSSGYPFGLIRYKSKFIPRTTATVEDMLTSTSATNALSANMGRMLEAQIKGHVDNADVHMTQAQKTKLDGIAEGATKVVPDDTTIKIDADGKISTAVDISKAVLTVNGFAPDEDGDIEISYKELTDVKLNDPVTDPRYIEGTSIQYMQYDPEQYREYIDSYHSLDIIPASKLSITTSKDSVNKVYYQHIVSIRDNTVYGSYVRTADEIGVWQPIVKVYNGGSYDPTDGVVLKVNGHSPNSDGEVTIPHASATELGLVKVDGSTIRVDTNGVISSVGGGTGGVSTVNGYSPVNGNVQIPHATATTEGLVKVADDLTTHALTDVVSAKVAESINNDLQGHKLSPDHLQGGERAKWDAKADTTPVSTTANGLMTKEDKVKLDGITAGATNLIPDNISIKLDQATNKISVNVTDSYQSQSKETPLSAFMGKYIYDKAHAHEVNHDVHVTATQKQKLDGIAEGATKTVPDGTTINIDNNGVISVNKDAIGSLHLVKTDHQLEVMSDNQHEFDMPLSYNNNPNGFITILFYNTLMVYETEYSIEKVGDVYKLQLKNSPENKTGDIYNLLLIGGGSSEEGDNLSLGSSGISATNAIRPSHAPSYYHEGITRGLIVGEDTDKAEWVTFINDALGWEYENLSYDIDVEVFKTDSSALQTVKVFNTSDTENHSVNYEYLIIRESTDLTTWSSLSTNPQIRYGKGNPNGIEFGLDGAIYFDSTNGLIYEMVNDDHTQVHNTGWAILSKPVNYRFEVVTQRVHLEDGQSTATYDFGAEYHDDYEWSAYDSGLRLFEDDGYFTEEGTTVSFTFHDGGAHYDTKITFVGERAVPILD